MTLLFAPIADDGPDTEPILASISTPCGYISNPALKRIVLQGIPFQTLQEPVSHRHALAPYLRQLTSTITLPPIDYKNCHRILDLGCRTGDWALDMARRHPAAWILAIDEDQTMIASAESQALTEGLSNIEFRVGDLTHTCIDGIKDYKDRPFNLIHASFIALSIDQHLLCEFIYGITRMLASNGLFQWTEMELPISSSRYVERFNRLISEALRLCGHAFCANDTIGITPMMSFWPKQYHLHVLHDLAHCIDISHGTKMRDPYYNYMEHLGRMMRPHIVRTGVASPLDYSQIFDKALGDLTHPSFCGLIFVRSLLLIRATCIPSVSTQYSNLPPQP